MRKRLLFSDCTLEVASHQVVHLASLVMATASQGVIQKQSGQNGDHEVSMFSINKNDPTCYIQHGGRKCPNFVLVVFECPLKA